MLDDLIRSNLKGRRDCDFSVNPGPNSCVDGGCNGGLVCTYGVSNPFDLLALLRKFTDPSGRPSDYPCRIYLER